MKNREARSIFPRRYEMASSTNCKRDARPLNSEAREERINSFNLSVKSNESFVRIKK